MRPIRLFLSAWLLAAAFTGANAQGDPMNDLMRLKDAQSRSISPENFTGERGKGGMATLAEGTAAHAARELGQGWKVNPYIHIEPGKTFTLGEIDGSGVINHIWMTPVGDYRLLIFRFYWDGEDSPSVEVPVGDFFASGWGMGNEPRITSLAVCVNARSGFNSYWQMPFRKGARVTMENLSDKRATIYYSINYSLEKVTADTPYFHAQFRRSNPLPYKQDFTIVDGIQGRGHLAGIYLAHGANSPGWWGEGEVKMFIDGDGQFPTICGTGEEDYFCGSYGYNERMEDGKYSYENFSSPYTGFHHIPYDGVQRRFGQYRWHITDPVRFEKDLRVTIQSLGWQSEGRYLPLEDDLASVAYWYQLEPHAPFPPLPAREALIIRDEYPLKGFGERNVFVDETTVRIEGRREIGEIRYTLDGSEPTVQSERYHAPITLSATTTVKARGFTDNEPITPILQGEFLKQEPRKADKPRGGKSGIGYQFFELDKALRATAELEGRPAAESGVSESLALPVRKLPEFFGMKFDGYLRVAERGIYTIQLGSNDGSRLYLGGALLIDNDGAHSKQIRTAQVALEPGLHALRLDYFQAGGNRVLDVTIEGPGLSKQLIGGDLLAH